MTTVNRSMNASVNPAAPRATDASVVSEAGRSQVLGRLGIFLLITIVIIAGLAQAQNMFNFPYYQDAEGTQIANAWSILSGGDLSPYTYAYDEPPGGSLVIASWALISGGLDSFGFSINSGRMLMLIAHVIVVATVYGVTRKVSGSYLAAIIASLIFSMSPLVTGLQRQVLLDNLMLVPLMLSFYLIVGDGRQMWYYFLSATLFGIAVLIKTPALFFLPGFILVLAQTTHAHHSRFARNLWLTLALIFIAFYPLYAQMRQELFPQGWIFGGDFPHVSLVERLVDRGPASGNFLNIGGGFTSSFNEWTGLQNFAADPILIYGGGLSLLFLLVLSFDNRRLRPVVIMAVNYILAMLLGGQIFSSDIIPLLPFLAIAVGTAIAVVANLISSVGGGVVKFVLGGAAALMLLYPFIVFYSTRTDVYTLDQVSGQVAAVDWAAQNLPDDAVIVTDNYAFVELRDTHPNTEYYWKVDTDPDVKFTLLNDDLCNIDYLILTPQVLSDVELFNLELMRRAYEQSERIIAYDNNGWPVEIYQVSKRSCQAPLEG